MSGPRTVLCFGDSNTHGTMPMAALDRRGRYRARNPLDRPSPAPSRPGRAG